MVMGRQQTRHPLRCRCRCLCCPRRRFRIVVIVMMIILMLLVHEHLLELIGVRLARSPARALPVNHCRQLPRHRITQKIPEVQVTVTDSKRYRARLCQLRCGGLVLGLVLIEEAQHPPQVWQQREP